MTNGWQVYRVGDLLTQNSNNVKVAADKSYKLLGISLEGRGAFLREEKTGDSISAPSLSPVHAGDFIYSRLFAWRGAFDVVSQELDGCFVSNEFPTFKINTEILLPKFLRLYFNRKIVWEEVEKYCTGTTKASRNRFKEQFFLDMEIPLPPLTEQRRIVAHIESLTARVDEAQRLREEASEETDYYKASLLNAAFAGKLLSNEAEVNKDFEDGRVLLEKILSERKELAKNGKYEIPSLPDPQSLPELPKGWVWVTVDHICSKVTDGFHNTPKPTESGFPYVLATHVKSNGIDFKNCFYVSEADHAELYAKTQVKRGDILVVNIGAGSGTPVIVNVDFEFSFKNVAILKRLSQVDEKFMYFYLLSKRAELFKEITKGGAQPFLSLKSLRTIPFPLAPLSEQKRIVAKLEELFSEVQKVSVLQEETRKEIDAFLPSILDRAFKGEL